MLCGQHALFWVSPAEQDVRMTIHGAPCLLSFSVSVSQSLHPVLRESLSSPLPHTQTHSLAHKEDGLIQRQESSRLLSLCFLLLHLPFPLTKTWLIHCLHLPTDETGRGRYRKHLGPARPHLSYFPRDFPHPSTDLRFVLTFCEITQV